MSLMFGTKTILFKYKKKKLEEPNEFFSSTCREKIRNWELTVYWGTILYFLSYYGERFKVLTALNTGWEKEHDTLQIKQKYFSVYWHELYFIQRIHEKKNGEI